MYFGIVKKITYFENQQLLFDDIAHSGARRLRGANSQDIEIDAEQYRDDHITQDDRKSPIGWSSAERKAAPCCST